MRPGWACGVVSVTKFSRSVFRYSRPTPSLWVSGPFLSFSLSLCSSSLFPSVPRSRLFRSPPVPGVRFFVRVSPRKSRSPCLTALVALSTPPCLPVPLVSSPGARALHPHEPLDSLLFLSVAVPCLVPFRLSSRTSVPRLLYNPPGFLFLGLNPGSSRVTYTPCGSSPFRVPVTPKSPPLWGR